MSRRSRCTLAATCARDGGRALGREEERGEEPCAGLGKREERSGIGRALRGGAPASVREAGGRRYLPRAAAGTNVATEFALGEPGNPSAATRSLSSPAVRPLVAVVAAWRQAVATPKPHLTFHAPPLVPLAAPGLDPWLHGLAMDMLGTIGTADFALPLSPSS
nr:unnamed protein product [Digitaria exilis]